MQALLALTRANIRSYTRDRAAVFWTLAFPLVFIVLFGLIFQGSGTTRLTIGWVDTDGSAPAQQLQKGFEAAGWGHARAHDAARTQPARCRSARWIRSSSFRSATEPPWTRPAPGPEHPSSSRSTRTRRGPAPGLRLPGGRDGPRRGQPWRPAAARRPQPADRPDREPQRDQLLRAEHARPLDHAGRHLRGDPARGRSREAHPQAPGRDAAPALAAGRLERADADPHRLHPGGHHRGRRVAGIRGRGRRQPDPRRRHS